MKKSSQNKEVEKLKKQVEKLKEDKASLQKANRNLKGKLNTAQSRNAEYRSALKKKEKSNAGLDKEACEQIMNLLDDIITPI